MVAASFLLALHGELTVVGKSPGGASMRLVPDSPDARDELARAAHKNVTTSDGGVRLRLGGIGTPETPFGRVAEPLGEGVLDVVVVEK